MKAIIIFTAVLALVTSSLASPRINSVKTHSQIHATLEEIIAQFQKTSDGIDAAVKQADASLKEILVGLDVLPQVETLLFNAETHIGIVAEGALNELIVNPEADHSQLVTNTLSVVGLLLVTALYEIDMVLADLPVAIQGQVHGILEELVGQCETLAAELIEVIESGRRRY